MIACRQEQKVNSEIPNLSIPPIPLSTMLLYFLVAAFARESSRPVPGESCNSYTVPPSVARGFSLSDGDRCCRISGFRVEESLPGISEGPRPTPVQNCGFWEPLNCTGSETAGLTVPSSGDCSSTILVVGVYRGSFRPVVSRVALRSCFWPFLCRRQGLRARRLTERILVGLKDPQDPGILVRDRHRCPLVSPALVERQNPGHSSLPISSLWPPVAFRTTGGSDSLLLRSSSRPSASATASRAPAIGPPTGSMSARPRARESSNQKQFALPFKDIYLYPLQKNFRSVLSASH